MLDVLIACIIFFCAVCVHSCLHRILLKRHKRSFSLMIVYVFFFFVLLYFLFIDQVALSPYLMRLPISALILYSLLTVLMGVLYLPSVQQGPQTPASQILSAINEGKSCTKAQILNFFSESLLISKRLNALEDVGLTQRNKNMYSCTPKGYVAYGIIRLLTLFLGLQPGG